MKPGIVKCNQRQLRQFDALLRRVFAADVNDIVKPIGVGSYKALEQARGNFEYLVGLRQAFGKGVDPTELVYLDGYELPKFLRRWTNAALAMGDHAYAAVIKQALSRVRSVGMKKHRNPTFGSYVRLDIPYKEFVELMREVKKQTRSAILVVIENRLYVKVTRDGNYCLLRVVKAGTQVALRPEFF